MRSRLVVTWLCGLGSLLVGVADLAAQSTASSAAGRAGRPPTEPQARRQSVSAVGRGRQLTEQQKTMMRHVLDGPRTAPNGPFNVMLRSPLMGDFAQELGAQVRFNSFAAAAAREMAILMAARHWTAHYEWNAHKTAALSAGLDPAIVAAIAAGERPRSMQAERSRAASLLLRAARDEASRRRHVLRRRKPRSESRAWRRSFSRSATTAWCPCC